MGFLYKLLYIFLQIYLKVDRSLRNVKPGHDQYRLGIPSFPDVA
jgi:hypothetical protein